MRLTERFNATDILVLAEQAIERELIDLHRPPLEAADDLSKQMLENFVEHRIDGEDLWRG